MEKRLMIPGVGQAGREQARCEDRPSGEGWKQPRWSLPRRTRTTGSWLPRGWHNLVLNCGWVKSSKLCNENTNSMYMAYLAILGILFFMIYEKTVNFLKTIMTTFPYLKWVGIQDSSVWNFLCYCFDNIADFSIIKLLNKHMTQLSENEYLGIFGNCCQKDTKNARGWTKTDVSLS